ncbi:MAG: glycosyltransferase [Verrucomicrobiota bacterium]
MDKESHDTTGSELVALIPPGLDAEPPIRRYLGGAWRMHLPFAWDLMHELNPAIFVELGVYRGESYFAFCQSAAQHGLQSRCYGIDTWRGDIHMGNYSSSVEEEVRLYNRRYSSFSNLLRMTFNEALAEFTDGSIDLLHIDGSHRYEDVRQDFENWLPKVSPQGIVLFHDVFERAADFGVWQLWEEIARQGSSFVFAFGHGLGVWRRERPAAKDPSFIQGVLLADSAERERIVARYHLAGTALAVALGVSTFQVFTRIGAGSHDSFAGDAEFTIGKWQRVRVTLLGGGELIGSSLRFDPGNQAGVIEIAGIVIRSKDTRDVLWRAKGPVELSSLVVGGTATTLSDDRVFRILNFGNDPQVLLPAFQLLSAERSLSFEIWLRLDVSAERLGTHFAEVRASYLSDQRRAAEEKHTQEQRRVRIEAELREAEKANASKQTEITALSSRLERARKNNEAKQTEVTALSSRLDQARKNNESNQSEIHALRSELDRLDCDVWENKVRRADLAARLQERDNSLGEIQKSIAWKAAKPFWKIQRHFSRPRSGAKAAADRNDLSFALDNAGQWNTTHDVLTLKGWCFARSGPPVAGLRAKVGRKSYFARYGLPRTDGAAAALDHPATVYRGFTLKVPIPNDATALRLEAIVQGGAWQCFLEHPLSPTTLEVETTSLGKTSAFPSPNGKYERRAPMLYPEITADGVVPLLSPLLAQHFQRTDGKIPIISVITPAFNTRPRWLVEAAASLLKQTFSDWEWCIVDDGSDDTETRQALSALASAHPRIRVTSGRRAGISAATNLALDQATGEFVCFLDHDDVLAPEALASIAEKLNEGLDVVYSDEDKLDDKSGTLLEAFFKPGWSPEYFRGVMYVGHLLCLRRELACRVRFKSEFDGIQDFEFMLRVSETTSRIGHVPKVLYHWRKTPGSIAQNADAKPNLGLLQQRAVNDHLARISLPAQAQAGVTTHRLKIVPAQRASSPRISIIIPTKDASDLLAQCLKSLFEKTKYSNFEVLLIDNDTTSPEAFRVMGSYPVVRYYLPNPFNFSRANNLAAQHATGEYLVFLNNDTEIVAPHWLDHLLYYVSQSDVGAAGALLLHGNGAVQHGGVVLGMRGTADHAMRGFAAKSDGYAGSLSCAREVSAVTAACLAMRKSVFEEIGGFNEHFFTIYQDVDLCLRLRQQGLRIIWTPQALLLHHESHSRQDYYDVVDRYLLLDQWENVIKQGDPYYNPNLNLERGDYSFRS